MTTLVIGKMNYDSQILKSNSETCLEEAVYVIKRDYGYTGILNLSMDTWNCNIEIYDKPETTGIKIINIEATDDNGMYTFTEKELNINVDPFEISNI